MRSVIIFIHFYNIFTTNFRWKVVTSFNLNSLLKLLSCSLIITSNNFPPKIVVKILYKCCKYYFSKPSFGKKKMNKKNIILEYFSIPLFENEMGKRKYSFFAINSKPQLIIPSKLERIKRVKFRNSAILILIYIY